MTSGPTKIPPQQIPGQTPPAKAPVEANVLLEKLPAELSDVKRTIEIQGRVTRDNRDGTLEIRTEKGDITVRADARELNIRQGDTVEVEIPPGRPPQEARVTETRPQDIPRTTQTPIDVQVRPAEALPEIPQTAPPARLSEGQVVRLQPLSPQEAAQYATLPVETVAAIIPEIIAAQTEIIAQDAVNELVQQAVTIPTSTTQNSVPNPTTLSQPLSQTPFPATSAVLINSPLVPPPLIQGDAPLQQATSVPASIATPQIPDILETITSQDISPLRAFLAPFRAQIAAFQASMSPAIVMPKITASPENLAKSIGEPMILQNHKAAEMPAIVTGMTPQKLPVISLFNPQSGENFFFIMHVPDGTVVPGAQLSLVPQQPLPANAPVLTAMVTSAPMPSYFLTPEPWPLMDEIYEALAQAVPQVAQAMANVTPAANNPATLGPAALFFLAAVRAGDLTQWLGNNAVDALRRGGRSGLVNRLAQEGSSLNRLASEPVSQEWRAVSLPMMFENHFHKIALYYKNDSEREQNDPRGKQTRFIFDLSLDAMGKVQLDGLFRAKRLDLIVRTLQPFSASMQQDMRRIYTGALGETNITGDLSFQNRPEQWVTITPEHKSNLGVSV